MHASQHHTKASALPRQVVKQFKSQRCQGNTVALYINNKPFDCCFLTPGVGSH